jgi:hypothetical protein
MAVGLMATAANAALIGARWAGNPDQKNFGNGTVEIWMNLTAGDVISGFAFEFATTDAPNLTIGNYQSGLGGQWAAGGIPGTLALGSGTQFNVSTPNAADNLDVAGPVVMGTFDVTITGPFDGTTKEIYLGAHLVPFGVFDQNAAGLTWDARYASTAAGYVAYMDWGNPGWGTKTSMGHQPTANPLLITKTPEPTSIALVALGGFALLRRRR